MKPLTQHDSFDDSGDSQHYQNLPIKVPSAPEKFQLHSATHCGLCLIACNNSG